MLQPNARIERQNIQYRTTCIELRCEPTQQTYEPGEKKEIIWHGGNAAAAFLTRAGGDVVGFLLRAARVEIVTFLFRDTTGLKKRMKKGRERYKINVKVNLCSSCKEYISATQYY